MTKDRTVYFKAAYEVGRYRWTVSKPVLKAPITGFSAFQRLRVEYHKSLQRLPAISTRAATTRCRRRLPRAATWPAPCSGTGTTAASGPAGKAARECAHEYCILIFFRAEFGYGCLICTPCFLCHCSFGLCLHIVASSVHAIICASDAGFTILCCVAGSLRAGSACAPTTAPSPSSSRTSRP